MYIPWKLFATNRRTRNSLARDKGVFLFSGSKSFAHAGSTFLLDGARQPNESDVVFPLASLNTRGNERRIGAPCAMAICVEVALLAIATGRDLFVTVSISGCCFALEWYYRRELIASEERGDQDHDRWSLIRVLLAVVFLIAGAIWHWLPAGGTTDHGVPGRAGYPKAGTAANRLNTSWVGIILWPAAPQKAKITPPPPSHTPDTTAGRFAKPLVIPFSGSYWYFKAPAKAPGLQAHVVHQSPTTVIIHSSDWHRLTMEAHQKLGEPIDLSCCREIDLGIRNADTRPGRIDIALKLIDSSTGQSQPLGLQPVLSSTAANSRLDRPPTDEVLRYRLPRNSRLSRFDEIAVVFEPAPERSIGGEQIAVREFRLLPEY